MIKVHTVDSVNEIKRIHNIHNKLYDNDNNHHLFIKNIKSDNIFNFLYRIESFHTTKNGTPYIKGKGVPYIIEKDHIYRNEKYTQKMFEVLDTHTNNMRLIKNHIIANEHTIVIIDDISDIDSFKSDIKTLVLEPKYDIHCITYDNTIKDIHTSQNSINKYNTSILEESDELITPKALDKDIRTAIELGFIGSLYLTLMATVPILLVIAVINSIYNISLTMLSLTTFPIVFIIIFIWGFISTYNDKSSDDHNKRSPVHATHLNDIIVFDDHTLTRRWTLIDPEKSATLRPNNETLNYVYKDNLPKISNIVSLHNLKNHPSAEIRAIRDACATPEKTSVELESFVINILESQKDHKEKYEIAVYEETYNKYKNKNLPLIETPYYKGILKQSQRIEEEKEMIEAYHQEKLQENKKIIESIPNHSDQNI